MKQSREILPIFVYSGAIFLGLVVFLANLMLGAAHLSFSEIGHALFVHAPEDQLATILWQIRLPRIVGAFLVGAALGVAGGIMQALTRNPMADPGLFGLSAGGNLGVILMMVCFPSAGYLLRLSGSFIGSAVATLIIFFIVAFYPARNVVAITILAGAALTAFFNGLGDVLRLTFHLSQEVSMWTSGGLIGTTWPKVLWALPFTLVGLSGALLFSKQLTLLSLDDHLAIGLGQRTRLVRVSFTFLLILLVGSSVALIGNFTFFGLMIPYLSRSLIGPQFQKNLPLSLILGGTLLMAFDLFARTIRAPHEVSLAAIVAICGFPFFLYILRRNKGGVR